MYARSVCCYDSRLCVCFVLVVLDFLHLKTAPFQGYNVSPSATL